MAKRSSPGLYFVLLEPHVKRDVLRAAAFYRHNGKEQIADKLEKALCESGQEHYVWSDHKDTQLLQDFVDLIKRRKDISMSMASSILGRRKPWSEEKGRNNEFLTSEAIRTRIYRAFDELNDANAGCEAEKLTMKEFMELVRTGALPKKRPDEL